MSQDGLNRVLRRDTSKIATICHPVGTPKPPIRQVWKRIQFAESLASSPITGNCIFMLTNDHQLQKLNEHREHAETKCLNIANEECI